ncbi:MAG: hypothetical protein WC710_11600 [Gallionella sp.]|jgi:hypothetical protein
MRRKLFVITAFFMCIFTSLSHAEAATSVKAVMTDSSPSRLTATKRVAITNVMVSFQASAGGEKTNTSGLFAAKTDASSTLQMPDMDSKLLAEIADDIYVQLKADLAANGFEVLPESTVLVSPAYKKIIAAAGITNFSKFSNMHGDVMLVGASGLQPYLPYNAETGKFGTPSKSLIKGWIGGWGSKSSTEGGPSGISIAEIYALPGLEVDLAKELNANLIKATYVVTLGSAKASVERFTGTHQDIHGNTGFSSTHTGSAFAQAGLLAGQSRIAFRTPSANAKGESAPGGYTSNFGSNASPAKDGDVVVTFSESLMGGTDFFSVVEPEATEKPGLLGALLGASIGTGADTQFIFTAKISDPKAYRTEVVSMVKLVQRDMLALIK